MTKLNADSESTACITQSSSNDKRLNSKFWLFSGSTIKHLFSGTIRIPPLSKFTMTHAPYVTTMPSVITPDSDFSPEGYVGPVTRSARKRAMSHAYDNIDSIDAHSQHSRCKSEKPTRSKTSPRSNAVLENEKLNVEESISSDLFHKVDPSNEALRDQTQNLSPLKQTPTRSRWKELISQHEIPRKLLHVSIGVFSIYFYTVGIQTTTITPWLLSAFIPILATDYLRFNYAPLNRIYIRVLGPLMRESEYQSYNGVIWYLIGAWFVLKVFPKDIGLMGILLLSWCDTAASTVGRALGRYTPSVRKGKSLAGSGAAFVVGVATAAAFWGWLAPRSGPFPGDENFPFMFAGTIRLPKLMGNLLDLSETQASISGWLALGVMSVWTGFIASASEALTFFGLDDNLTIPVLSGVGMWGFLKVFG